MFAELHQTEIDGVRCFWVDSGRPTLSAQLTFRQGMADETLAENGWLHLLEHLCLHGRGGGALQVNGSVSALTTEFSAHGPVEQVVLHLGGVARWLAAPDLRDLERERDVLRAESRLRAGAAPRAFVWRYGAAGPGLVGYDDPGLGRATSAALAARAARVYTRGNAVLALDGPPPAGLSLALPDGQLQPAPVAVAVDSGVAAYVEESGLVLSGVVTRSEHATVVPDIVRRALRQRFREQAGGAYAPWSGYERVDARHAVVTAGSDISPSLYPELAARVLDLVGRFAGEPVPAEWLAEVVAERLQAYQDPHNVALPAWRAASTTILGDPPEDLAQLVENTRRLAPDAVQSDLVDFCDSLLLGVPGETAWHDEVPMLTFPTTQGKPAGKGWRHREWPAKDTTLRVDASRLSVTEGGTTRELAVSDLAGLYCYPDGARQLVGRDGWALGVDPSQWRNGRTAVAALDAAVPAALHLPQLARHGYRPFQPTPWPRRWGRYLWQSVTGRWILTVLVAAGIIISPFVVNPLLGTTGTDAAWGGGDVIALMVIFTIGSFFLPRPTRR